MTAGTVLSAAFSPIKLPLGLFIVDYPCTCLCLGFSQMILIFPFLLITLHFSQIGFTDDLTFMRDPPFIHCSAFCSLTRFLLSATLDFWHTLKHSNARKRAYIV